MVVPTSGELAAKAGAAAQAAMTMQEYQLPDGTRVRRAPVAEVLAARRELQAEEQAAQGGTGLGQQVVLGRVDPSGR